MSNSTSFLEEVNSKVNIIEEYLDYMNHIQENMVSLILFYFYK